MENTIPVTPISTAPVVKSYYAVPVWKFILLTLLSVLYPTYWFWKNWTEIKQQKNQTYSPLLRALFSFLYQSEYAKEVQGSAKAKQYPHSFDPFLLALLYGAGVVAALFGFGLIGAVVSIGSLVPLLRAMAYVNTHTEGASLQTSVTRGEILITLIGFGLVWGSAIWIILQMLLTGGPTITN